MKNRRTIVLLAALFLSVVAQIFFQMLAPSKTTKPVVIPQEASATAHFLSASSSAAIVTRVIDGDTIELATGQRVRYIGVDTPETVDPRKPLQCFGAEARDVNKKLVEGKEVRLVRDVSDADKYGRLLRYVYLPTQAGVGDIFVNDYLVRQGYAHVSTFAPDVAFSEQFAAAQTEAEMDNRGLWRGCKK